MKIGKLGYLSFSMLLAGLVACSDDGNGGGGGDDDGGSDDGGGDDSGGGDDDDGGTEPDAGGDGADAAPGACLGAPTQAKLTEDWVHVPEGSEIVYQNEPPSSGPHYAVWATYDVHAELARGYYVHNLEHGGIVLVYRPDAPDEVAQALRAAYDAIPDDEDCGHRRTVLAQDPELTTPVAVIAADWVMSGDCIDAAAQDAILTFVTDHRGVDPEEDICDQGTVQ